MKDKECWKPIPGFIGYEVSNLGRVRSYFRRNKGKRPPFWIVADEPQRILKGSPDRGYPGVGLSVNGKFYYKKTHQLIMLSFVGPCPDGMEICHNDSDPRNCTLSNLRYDTRIKNASDRCKFDDNEITDIRTRGNYGEDINKIAEEYNTNVTFIKNICSGEVFRILGSGPFTQKEELHAVKYEDDIYEEAFNLLESGLRQDQVADKIGVHYSTVSRWVNGSRSQRRWNKIKRYKIYSNL